MRFGRTWSLLAVGTLAACSVGPSAGDNVNLDLAAAAAENAAQNIEVMRGPGGIHGFGLRFDPSSFDCESRSHEGLTVTMTCTYKDAAGNTQAAYDALTTASAAVHASVSGSFDRGHMSGSVDRQSDLSVTGLAGVETRMTWNGAETGTMTHGHPASGDEEARQYQMTFTATTTNVVIPVPRTPTSWPLSGSTTSQVTITFTGGDKDGTTEQRNVTVTFDGTQYASVTVNGETFTVDLAKRGRPERGHRKP